ncbi:MAG TPA: CheR family methyltransferase [Roseiflexaceae bacterium]|nr:CheR family methyltransferase [Roseiflexaceae bacterium]HMP39975.1 CheR family methyltransferase [Roseiflexaceae bacterium]
MSRRSATTDAILSAAQFSALRDMIAAYGGIVIDTGNRRMLESAVAARLTLTGRDLPHYLHLIGTPAGHDELRRLIELVVNHETLFFRNAPHFRALRDVLLTELDQARPPGVPLRIWSAGCATGEEAYSLALTARATLGPQRPLQIIGSDLSEPALERARHATYRGRTLNNVPPEWLERYFIREGDTYRITNDIRELVRFRWLNLLEPIPADLHGVDLIFCQNVTIYFHEAARRALMARFHQALAPDGLLFLGFSETLWNVFDGFQSRSVADAYVYVKAVSLPHAPLSATRKAAASPGRQRRMPAATPPATASPPVNHAGLARAHADRGELDQAMAEARQALAVDPLDEHATLLLGILHARHMEWEAAITQLERARYLNPNAPLISFHLATTYEQCGRAEQAVREYRNTLRKLEPHPPETILDGVSVAWLRETCQAALRQ